MKVLAKMNRTVKLYCSVKRPSGDWGTKPVRDKQLMNLKDLPEGQGHYYLAYYEGKHRQMPPVGRFADAAKQKLVQKRKELDARATGVELLPETKPEPTEESNLAHRVEKYLSQMMAFVGNDGYGRTKKIRERLPQSLKLLSAFLRPQANHGLEAWRLRSSAGICWLAPQADKTKR